MTATVAKLTGRRIVILLVQVLVSCALLAAPAGASVPFVAAGRSDSALCPMRAAASEYANAGRSVSAPALHEHFLPADAGRDHAEYAHAGHDHAALAGDGHEYACGETASARHNASPAQENNCRCDPYSMSCCFSFTSPALLFAGEAFIRPAQRALHEPNNDTPLSSRHDDNLFRPPRIPSA